MVESISKFFVPVALNTDRLPKDADGDFFRELMKRWPQGLWVITPEGKTLAFDYHKPDSDKNFAQNQQKWLDGTKTLLEEARKLTKDLKAREVRSVNPFPDRGLGLRKDGGVRIAASVIGLRNGKQDGAPAVDSAVLSKKDWAAFAPFEEFGEWNLSEAGMKTFSVALSPLTDSIMVPVPKDMTRAEGSAKLLRFDGDLAVIQFTGKWESKHNRDGNEKFPIDAQATGEGIGIWDTKARAYRNILFVLKGTYRNGKAVTPIASVLEWQLEKKEE